MVYPYACSTKWDLRGSLKSWCMPFIHYENINDKGSEKLPEIDYGLWEYGTTFKIQTVYLFLRNTSNMSLHVEHFTSHIIHDQGVTQPDITVSGTKWA